MSVSELRQVLEDIASKVGEIHHDWPGVRAQLKAHERRLEEHERRIIRVEGRVQSFEGRRAGPRAEPTSDPPPTSAEQIVNTYGLRAGNTGSFRVTPDVLDSVAKRFHEQELQRVAIEEYVTKWKSRILFIVALAVPIGAVLSWVAIHVFHL